MRRFLPTLFLWLIALWLILPFIVVLGVSFNAEKNIAFPPSSLSLRWYAILVTDTSWLIPIRNSVGIALAASALSTSIALVANFLLWRLNNRFMRAIIGLGVGPFLLPPVILALGASIFWAEAGLYGRVEATIISHGVFLVPLSLIIIGRGFALLSTDVIEASRTLGANGAQTLRRVILPLVSPYIATGFALVAIISVNEYLIASMISGFTVETLPIRIFNNVRYGYTPVVASAAMGFVFLTVGTLLLVSRFTDLLNLFGGVRD